MAPGHLRRSRSAEYPPTPRCSLSPSTDSLWLSRPLLLEPSPASPSGYPVLLVLALPALIGGGAFFWKHKAKERELRERELADAVAERADRENQLAQEGDPRGTHGRYMPPPKDLS